MKIIINLLLLLYGLTVHSQTCDSTLLAEPFDMNAPSAWSGDFNMLSGGLVEGWLTATGPSMTAGTGPQVPAEGSHYLYMESSGPAGSNSMYSIQTPVVEIPGDGASSLELSYMMYGSDIGSFVVEALIGSSSDTLFMRSGQQHSDGTLQSWESITLDLTPYAGTPVQIQFTGMKMVTGMGDIAIDNVNFCYAPPAVVPVPAMGTWALISLALLMLIIGLVAMQESTSSPQMTLN